MQQPTNTEFIWLWTISQLGLRNHQQGEICGQPFYTLPQIQYGKLILDNTPSQYEHQKTYLRDNLPRSCNQCLQ
ncbi:hypothetical protein DPMN_175699 [Dreissena polymorpha]|uniref:Uncharacterized protein n=1 Tax=Dreissena polymorpha TaxID=45954 RepID=A0A9D4IHH3_DREPO|nr:hypothetical protein DPMN_175699 [Dreissena polymorpha]